MPPGYLIYQNEMIQAGHGFPVWDGDPYSGQEIQIGDVGYMDEGAFRSIKRSPQLAYNASETVERLIDFQTALVSSSLEEREFTADVELEADALPVNAVGRVSFATSRSAIAVLNVEQGDADFLSCSEGDKYAMGQQFLQNAQSWLQEAATAGIVPAHFPVGRLILVTGFYKTWNWAAMALSSNSSQGGLGFSVMATRLGSGGLSYDWNDVQQVTPARSSGHHHSQRSVPPVTVAVGTPPTSKLFARCCRGHHDVRNQCIFLRGFRYRERAILRDELKVLAPPVDWTPSLLRKILGRTPNPTSTPTSEPPAVPPKGPRDESAHVAIIDGLPDPDACDTLYDAIALEKFTQEKALSAVVVHDDELIALLERCQSGEELHDPKLVGQHQTSIHTPELLMKNDLPKPTQLQQANPSRIYALIIGINVYKSDTILDARQAVSDALAIKNCLMSKFNVGLENISMLLDEAATRHGIISGLISLRDNVKIQRGDAILIYYAGCGSANCISPQDADEDGNNQISGRTFGWLIYDIMLRRGDNVTIILDGAHFEPRRLEEDQAYTYEDFFRQNPLSCVLLTGCGAGGVARDGYFTPSLVNALESVSPDELTYVELLNRLQNITKENPQLKGTNRHRLIFNWKTPVRVYNSYSLSSNNVGHYILHAGAADGVCLDAEFKIYADHGKRLESVMVPADIQPFRTVMRALLKPFPSLNQAALAVQSRMGLQEELKIFVLLQESFIYVVKAALMEMTALGYRITLVNDRSVADLAMENLHGKIGFVILDKRVTAHGLTVWPYTAEANVEDLMPVLHHAAHYHYHLNRSNSIFSEIEREIIVEIFKLKLSDELDTDTDTGRRFRRPINENLLKDGIITLPLCDDIDDNIFGIRITNNSQVDFYPNIFYFDHSELSITQCYESGSPSQFKVDCPLPTRSTLYFSFSRNISSGQDVDVGFLKCFFSTSPIDLSRIAHPLKLMSSSEPQAPAELMHSSEPQAPAEPMHRSEPQAPAELMHSSEPGPSKLQYMTNPRKEFWGSISIPVVQRRISNGPPTHVRTEFRFQAQAQAR